MAMFKRFFGGPADGPADKKNAEHKTMDALSALRQKEQINTEKMAHLQSQIDAQDTVVRKLLQAQQKDKAKMALKRKKMLEKQVEAVQNNSDRIMEQIMQLDMAQNNILTVQALAQAAEAGKANLKANNLENVDQVLEDIAEQNDQMQQMQDALAMPTGAMAGMDDEDLEGELEEMNNMQMDEDLAEMAPPPQTAVPGAAVPAAATAVPHLPSAPTATAAAPAKTEEDLELEALQKELGMEAA